MKLIFSPISSTRTRHRPDMIDISNFEDRDSVISIWDICTISNYKTTNRPLSRPYSNIKRKAHRIFKESIRDSFTLDSSMISTILTDFSTSIFILNAIKKERNAIRNEIQ